MRQRRSSVFAEILWLAYFLAVFAGLVYFAVIFVVPHHFNDKIAIALAGLFAGVIMIATRAAVTARKTQT
jgi:hypothetical protein